MVGCHQVSQASYLLVSVSYMLLALPSNGFHYTITLSSEAATRLFHSCHYKLSLGAQGCFFYNVQILLTILNLNLDIFFSLRRIKKYFVIQFSVALLNVFEMESSVAILPVLK